MQSRIWKLIRAVVCVYVWWCYFFFIFFFVFWSFSCISSGIGKQGPFQSESKHRTQIIWVSSHQKTKMPLKSFSLWGWKVWLLDETRKEKCLQMKTDKKMKLAIWLNYTLVLIMKLYNIIWSNGKSITVFKVMSSLSATNTIEHPVPYYSEQHLSQSSALRLRELVLAVTSLISPEDAPWFISHHFSKPHLQEKLLLKIWTGFYD